MDDGRYAMRWMGLVLALLALPRVAAAQQPEAIEYYGQDVIGSIRIVFDAYGNVISRQDFTPFGTPVRVASPMLQEGFGGQERDDESNEDYFHVRMFEARLGRFATVDPVPGNPSQAQTLNRFAYATDNPLRFTDFNGLSSRADGDDDKCTDPAKNGTGWICKTTTGSLPTVDDQGTSAPLSLPASPEIDRRLDRHGFRRCSGGIGICNRDGTPVKLTLAVAADIPSIRVSQRGIDAILKHLSTLDHAEYNDAMIAELTKALQAGQAISGPLANFYLHELKEANLVAQGLAQEFAHAAALEHYGMTAFDLYTREIVERFSPSLFNSNWRRFWGLP